MKIRTLVISLVGALVVSMWSTPVLAQSDEKPAVMTDSHIQRIKQNCKAATRTIQQIHANDGPLRVNRGQVYDSLMTKLMTPLNSRLIVNKLDASSMVKTTARYSETLAAFRENYKKYDNQMSAVLELDCVKQPVRFYDAVTDARQLRGVVHGDVLKLHAYIIEYGDAFGGFRTQFNEGKVKGSGE